jgi:hypothetical protein
MEIGGQPSDVIEHDKNIQKMCCLTVYMHCIKLIGFVSECNMYETKVLKKWVIMIPKRNNHLLGNLIQTLRTAGERLGYMISAPKT